MEAVVIALRVVTGVVVLDVVLAFVLQPRAFPRRVTGRLTRPLYLPFQRVFDPRRLGADFSPMIVVMGLTTLGWLLAPELVGGSEAAGGRVLGGWWAGPSVRARLDPTSMLDTWRRRRPNPTSMLDTWRRRPSIQYRYCRNGRRRPSIQYRC